MRRKHASDFFLTRLFALIVCLLSSAVIEAESPPVAWVARHGLSSDEYQKSFDEFAEQGYRLVSVSGYTSDGHVRYAALWRKLAGPAWVARHGLSADEYQ